jgi:hypothetical protein
MVLACTVVTKSYLPFARVLARSLEQHNPGSHLLVLVVDELGRETLRPKEPFQILELKDLQDERTNQQMAFAYHTGEMCSAVKGLLLEYMLTQTNHDRWVYLDADTQVFGSLQPFMEELEGCSVLLTSHAGDPPPWPAPDDARRVISELSYRIVGPFNGGALALRRCPETVSFVGWLRRRLELWSLFSREETFMGDQTWLNLALMYFKDVRLTRHQGVNAGIWNFLERSPSLDNGQLKLNGDPLLLFHFSGLTGGDWRALFERMVRERNMAALEAGRYVKLLETLVQDYLQAVACEGWTGAPQNSYSFGTLTDGTPIPKHVRRSYLGLRQAGWQLRGSPFDHRLWQIDGRQGR